MAGVSYYAILHYDGGRFAGWQRQPAVRTVQAALEDALERLAGGRVVTNAAGRTDAGVHALGQVVSFRLPVPRHPREVLRALRALTPHDLWVARVGEAPAGFHARRQATSRRYRYVIGCDPAASSPFRRPYEWVLAAPIEAALLSEAGSLFLGEHDFRAFSSVGQRKPHYRCRVTVAEWQARLQIDGFIFTIEADRFLHRMVRFLVGVMVDVARERRPLDDIRRLLEGTSNQEASPPAPPHGLYLIGARYPQLHEGYDR